MNCPEKRMRESLATLENIDFTIRKKKGLKRNPKGALADIMNGEFLMCKVNTESKKAKRFRRKNITQKEKGADLANTFKKLFEQDKENINLEI